MSDSANGGYLALFAVFVVLILIILLYLDWPTYVQDNFYKRYHKKWDRRNEYDHISEPEYGKAKDRHEHNHRAQEKYYWVLYIIVSILGISIATIAAIYAGGAFYEARRQADIAEAANALDKRPWIAAPTLDIDPAKKGSDRFVFHFKNIGKTPTTSLFIAGDIYDRKDIWAHHVEDDLCIKADAFTKADGGFPYVSILPESELAQTGMPTPLVFPKSLDAFAQGDALDRTKHGAVIVGCVIYKKRFDSVDHHTPFGLFISDNKVVSTIVIKPD